MTTIPKNKILNFLYSTDRNVSLVKLGDWLEVNTDGKYKIVSTDTQTQSMIKNHPKFQEVFMKEGSY